MFWLTGFSSSPKTQSSSPSQTHSLRIHRLLEHWNWSGLQVSLSANGIAYLSRIMTKPTKWYMRPAKTQISLGIRPVWSESSLCAQWVAKDPRFLHADSEDSYQTVRMPRLISVFDGRTCHFVGFVMGWLILPQWSKFLERQVLVNRAV